MNRQLLNALVFCMALASLMGCSQGQQASISAEGCDFHKSWLDPHELPTEVPGEEQKDGASLCQFHQFVVEHFIAETFWKPNPKFPDEGYLDWMPVSGVFTSEGNVQKNPTPWGERPKIPKELCPNAPETAPVFSDLVYQASKGHPSLMDQTKDYVFYDVRMNKTQYDYTIECDLQAEDKTCKNKKVDGTRYPEGSVETKIGWKILKEGTDDPAKYITVKGWVKNPEDNKICTEETLGMVGYHLVIASKRHPEFIWGTFEHIDNNPDCANRDAKPPTSKNWSFYNKDCPECPINTFERAKPTQVCLQHPQGGGPDENKRDIILLNASYQGVLGGSRLGNYKFVGSLWTKGGVPPHSAEDVQKGSLFLANSVAETYIQGDAKGDGTLNCFACHRYTNTDEALKVSHITEVLQKKSPTLRAKMKMK